MARERQQEWDVFVSHSRINKQWVRESVAEWRAKGLRIFFDEDSIQPGEDIVTAIERGLTSSRKVVLILSPASVNSNWVALEQSIALFEDIDEARERIIPVLLEPIDRSQLKISIRKLNAVDLTDPSSRAREYERLLKALGLSDRIWPFPVISAMGTKGGTGKTTVMRAIAELIASTGAGVLIIDSDITSAGMTNYWHQRTSAFPAVWTVMDNAFAKQNAVEGFVKRDLGAWDVTPEYLKKQRMGHIYLIPARAFGDGRIPFNALADIHPDQRRNEAALDILRETINRARDLPAQIDAVLIDSGADNNPLVSAGVALADYGYIVSNPNTSFAGEILAAERMHTERYPQRQQNSMIILVNQATPAAIEQWSSAAKNALFIREDPEFREKAAEGDVDFEGVGLNNLYLEVLNVLKTTLSTKHQALLPDPIQIWIKPYLRGMKVFPEATLARPRYRFLVPRTLLTAAAALAIGVTTAWNSAAGFIRPKTVAVQIVAPAGVNSQEFVREISEIKIPENLSHKVLIVQGTLIVSASLSGTESAIVENEISEPKLRQAVSDALRAAESEQITMPIANGLIALLSLVAICFFIARFVTSYQRITLLRRIIAMRDSADDGRFTQWLHQLMVRESKDRKLRWLREQYREWLESNAISGSLDHYRAPGRDV